MVNNWFANKTFTCHFYFTPKIIHFGKSPILFMALLHLTWVQQGVGAARRGAALLTSHWHLWLWKYFEMYTVMSARPTLTTFESNCRARICYYCFFFFGVLIFIFGIFLCECCFEHYLAARVFIALHTSDGKFSQLCMYICMRVMFVCAR